MASSNRAVIGGSSGPERQSPSIRRGPKLSTTRAT